jgi:hypothetical protein
VLALGGCTTGSVDDVEPGETSVELQVEGYLRALADHQPARACSKLTPTYQGRIAYSDPKLRRVGIGNCQQFARLLASSEPFTFEGRPVDVGSIDDLRWSVDVQGDNATAVGPYGKTTFKLRKLAGDGWRIDSIDPVQA